MTMKETKALTNLHPDIQQFQETLWSRYQEENKTVKPGQILFVGSSLMEIFPIEKMQAECDLGLDKHIYNRGVRATTTADLLAHMAVQVFDLAPSKIVMNIGSNDIGFGVPEATFLANYDSILTEIKEKLPTTEVYVMAYYPTNHTGKFSSDEDENQLLAKRGNDAMAAASKKVAELAVKHGVHYINANAGLTDDAGNLKAALTFDGAHMLPAGYDIVFQNLKPYLG